MRASFLVATSLLSGTAGLQLPAQRTAAPKMSAAATPDYGLLSLDKAVSGQTAAHLDEFVANFRPTPAPARSATPDYGMIAAGVATAGLLLAGTDADAFNMLDGWSHMYAFPDLSDLPQAASSSVASATSTDPSPTAPARAAIPDYGVIAAAAALTSRAASVEEYYHQLSGE